MVVRDNRITVTLSEKLLKFLNDEVQRQGINPKKKGTILAGLLSREYDRVTTGGGQPINNGAIDVEAISDRVAERALQKIEIRLNKKKK